MFSGLGPCLSGVLTGGHSRCTTFRGTVYQRNEMCHWTLPYQSHLQSGILAQPAIPRNVTRLLHSIGHPYDSMYPFQRKNSRDTWKVTEYCANSSVSVLAVMWASGKL